jgi:glucose-1-phosphate adenylyltransferase
VERSILSPGVIVKKGAVVRDSIIMHDCVVETGAQLSHVVSDRDVHFGMNSRVGEDREGMPESEHLVLVGKAARIGDKATVTAGTQVPVRSVVK